MKNTCAPGCSTALTRSVSLTEAGEEYFQRCRQILQDIDEAELSLASDLGRASGRLRLVVGFSEGLHILSPHLAEFRRRYPDVQLEIQLAERVVDLVEENFDLGIQPRPFVHSRNSVARHLMQARLVLCASPGYVSEHGLPLAPADLKDHACVNFSLEPLRQEWVLVRADGSERIKPNNVLVSNNIEVLFEAMRGGVGIGLAFEWLIRQDLASGRLVRILPAYHADEMDYQVVYPSRKFLPQKTRAMIDFLFAVFGDATRATA